MPPGSASDSGHKGEGESTRRGIGDSVCHAGRHWDICSVTLLNYGVRSLPAELAAHKNSDTPGVRRVEDTAAPPAVGGAGMLQQAPRFQIEPCIPALSANIDSSE